MTGVHSNAASARSPEVVDDELGSWNDFIEAATHLYVALNRKLLEDHKLSLLDVTLLRTLANADQGSARMGELAQELALRPSRVSEQVRRLESEGLVSRTTSKRDRRGVVATITREGRARLQLALATYASGVRSLYLGPLSRQQMTALGDSARRIDWALRAAGLPNNSDS